MAYSAHVGSFNLDSAVTAGNDQSVTGIGFQPEVVLFWWSGSTASVDDVSGADIALGFGAAISDSSRFCVTSASDDAQATSDTYVYQTVNGCIRIYSDGSGTLDGQADLKSLDADGFTLNIDDQFASDWRVSYLALGGTDLTGVYIGSKQRDSDLGNCAVTGVGFQPDAVIICSGLGTGSTGAGLAFSLGWATGSSNQGTVSAVAQNGQSTTATAGYGYNGEILARVNAFTTGGATRDTFVSFDADGFTLNQLEDTSARYYSYICLAGGQYVADDLTTRTDGNDIEEDPGFEPAAVLFASANAALDSQDSGHSHARVSIGAGTSTSNRAVQAISDEDNLADTETAYTNQDDAVYAHVVDDAIEALMDISSIDADGFTCVMDDTETSGCWVMYLAIGAEAGGGSASESASPSLSESASPSLSESASESVSPSISESASESISPSISPSISESISPSLSESASPSISESVSPSLSESASPSLSESASPSLSESASPSLSESASESVSPSLSESASPSLSESASPSPGPTGDVCWGHVTGVLETNILPFNGNWTGTGEIENPGANDNERLALEAGEYMISEMVNTGVITCEILQNEYALGDDVDLDYRHGATAAACAAAAWGAYVAQFESLGYVQIRVTSTL